MQGIETGRPVEERPLRDLLAEFSRDGSLLVQQELALAKVELSEKANKLKADVAAITGGALVLYAGLLTLIAAAVLALAQVMPGWVAALLVGAAVTTIGGVLVMRGKKKLEHFEALPKKTIESVQRDAQTIKEAVR